MHDREHWLEVVVNRPPPVRGEKGILRPRIVHIPQRQQVATFTIGFTVATDLKRLDVTMRA